MSKNETTQPAVVKQAQGERFTNAVMSEIASNVGQITLTSFQKRLLNNYFIKLDRTLREAEIKRLQKKTNQDPTPLTWENVNMSKLAQDVMSCSLVGLDPLQPNHISLIPYKNNSTGKYDVKPIIGYRGTEIKAKKYALTPPDDVVIELVYSNDKFKEFKKSASNRIESYEFEVTNSFDRGEIIGGFYYTMFFEHPELNRLVVMTKDDIDKRRPEYASAEFWGGTRDKWENGKKAGTEEIEGWYKEMAYKTVFLAAYNSFTIDSEKIDEHFSKVVEIEENEYNEKQLNVYQEVKAEIKNEIKSESVEFVEVPKEKPTKKAIEPNDLFDKSEPNANDPSIDPGF